MTARLRAWVLTPGAAVAGSVVLAGAFLFTQGRRLYFYGDDWDFLLQRHLGWGSVMRPHTEHWSTLPIIAFRIMVRIFGIGHYPAYALMSILLHAACCALVYRLMRTNGISGWPAAIVVIPFAFLCGGLGENPLWDFQIGFLGSAAFGLLALTSASGPGRTRLVLTWSAMAGSFLCSGMALPMLAWLGLYTLLTRGLRRALVVTVPLGLLYVLWFATYGRTGTADVPPSSGSKYVIFVSDGLGALWQQVVRLPGTGGVVLVGLIAVAWLGRSAAPTRALALSGALAAVITYLFIGVSRAGLGPAGAEVSRYAYFGILFTLPAAAVVCSLVAHRLRTHRIELVVAGTLVVVLLVGNGVVQARSFTTNRLVVIGNLRGTLPATEQLLDEKARLLQQQPSPARNPQLTAHDVAQALAEGNLTRTPATPRAVLDAAAFLQVAARADDYGLPGAAGLRTEGVIGSLDPSTCSSVRAGAGAYVDLPPTTTGSQIVLRSGGTFLPARLIQGARVSVAQVLVTVPGRFSYVASTASRATLRVNLPPGPLTLCPGGHK